MNIFSQLVIIFSVCFLGEVVCSVLPFSFPASVMGMVLMLVFLLARLVKLEQIKDTSEFLLSNMAFFFIPAGIGIIENYGQIEGKIMVLLFICTLITIITFVTTAYTVSFVIKLQNRKRRLAK